jgi:lipopolysaccharide transport protein LptA
MLKENSVKILTSRNPALPVFATSICVLWFLLFFFSATAAFAKNTNKSDDDKMAEKPLHVVSDKMVAQKDTSMIEFIGNVKATREDSIILADSIKIFIHTAETKIEGKTDLKKIIATGNVEYTAGERKVFADKAVYTTADEILILTGKACKLITGKSHVTGNKITLFRNDDRAIVESDGKTRVQAIFNPEDGKKGN